MYISRCNGCTLDQEIADVIKEHQLEHGHTSPLRLLKHLFNKYWQYSAGRADSFRKKKKDQTWLSREIKLDKLDLPLGNNGSGDASDNQHMPEQTL